MLADYPLIGLGARCGFGVGQAMLVTHFPKPASLGSRPCRAVSKRSQLPIPSLPVPMKKRKHAIANLSIHAGARWHAGNFGRCAARGWGSSGLAKKETIAKKRAAAPLKPQSDCQQDPG